MITLNDNDSIKYTGGAKITSSLVIILTAIGSFILGIVDGITNPKACNSK